MSATKTIRAGGGWLEAASSAHDGLSAVLRATARLHEAVASMDQEAVEAPTALPGWTRGHVITHIARNADALVNLLMSAKTGVPRPMYASAEARDADIADGAIRPPPELLADLTVSGARFLATAEQLSPTAWRTMVKGRTGPGLPAAKIAWLQLDEVLIHLVDLDCGVDFAELVVIAGDQLIPMLDCVVSMYSGRPEAPATELTVALPSGQQLTWAFGTGEPAPLTGTAEDGLSWLTGRSDGRNLTGDTPELPNWL